MVRLIRTSQRTTQFLWRYRPFCCSIKWRFSQWAPNNYLAN